MRSRDAARNDQRDIRRHPVLNQRPGLEHAGKILAPVRRRLKQEIALRQLKSRPNFGDLGGLEAAKAGACAVVDRGDLCRVEPVMLDDALLGKRRHRHDMGGSLQEKRHDQAVEPHEVCAEEFRRVDISDVVQGHDLFFVQDRPGGGRAPKQPAASFERQDGLLPEMALQPFEPLSWRDGVDLALEPLQDFRADTLLPALRQRRETRIDRNIQPRAHPGEPCLCPAA